MKGRIGNRGRVWRVTLGVVLVLAVVPTAAEAARSTKPTVPEPGTRIEADGRGRVRTKGIVRLGSLPQTNVAARSGTRSALRLDGTRRPAPERDLSKPKAGDPKAGRFEPRVVTPTRILQNLAGTSLGTSSCGCEPPDPNGAVNGGYLVEAVNTALAVYRKSDGALLSRVSLASFLGSSDSLADPRVFYDNTWNRWVLVVILKPPSTTSTPAAWVAASQTSNPLGGWWRFRITFGGSAYPLGTLLDYPLVGIDADAVVITTNNFQRTSAGTYNYLNSHVFALPKARIYNGFGFSFPAFPVLFSTHPSLVAGRPTANPGRTYLLTSLIPYGLNSFDLYYMTNSSRPDLTAVTYVGRTAANGFGAPNPGQQPGGTRFDALDGRLQSAPAQLGSRIWFARASGFPVIQYGYVTTGLGLVAAVAYVSGSSYDWNPSIGVSDAGGGNGYVWLNWAFAIPASNVPISMRVSGLSPSDPVQSLIGIGVTVATGSLGPTSTGVRRFGDYSSVAVDPTTSTCAAGRGAMITNQLFTTSGQWRSRMARVGFC